MKTRRQFFCSLNYDNLCANICNFFTPTQTAERNIQYIYLQTSILLLTETNLARGFCGTIKNKNSVERHAYLGRTCRHFWRTDCVLSCGICRIRVSKARCLTNPISHSPFVTLEKAHSVQVFSFTRHRRDNKIIT